MIKSFFAAALSLSTLSASASVTYDVYVIAGQSNADGRGLASDLPTGSPLALPQNNTLISYLNPADPSEAGEVDVSSNGFVTLEPGFSQAPGENRAAGAPSGIDYFGPELSFASSIGQATGSGNPVAIIKVTRGGTSLRADWRVGDPAEPGVATGFLYTELIDHITSSLSELNQDGNTANLRGVLWHQGESDSGSGSANAYAGRITDLIEGVRDNFGEDLPFVLGELSRERSNSTLFNQNINAFVESQEVPNLGLVSSEGLPVIGDGDVTHFNAEGQVELGLRYATALAALLPDPLSVLAGDYNNDGFVGQSDLDLVLLNFGNTQLPEGFNTAALPNGQAFDGQIGQNELDGVLLNFGIGSSSTSAALTAVPEPASMALLGLGGCLLSGRRRR